jgi:hypothetical protein
MNPESSSTSTERSQGVLSALWPNCREAIRLQSDALERPLPLLKRIGLRIHLILCRWCRRYGKQIRFMRSALRGHPDSLPQSSPQSLSSPARERIKDAIRNSKG